MPQQFQAVRCYKCMTFQSQLVKKVQTFCCAICREKQTIQRVYAISHVAKDIRLHVQRLNMDMAAATELAEDAAIERLEEQEARFDEDHEQGDAGLQAPVTIGNNNSRVAWDDYAAADDYAGAAAPGDDAGALADEGGTFVTVVPDRGLGRGRGRGGGAGSVGSKRAWDGGAGGGPNTADEWDCDGEEERGAQRGRRGGRAGGRGAYGRQGQRGGSDGGGFWGTAGSQGRGGNGGATAGGSSGRGVASHNAAGGPGRVVWPPVAGNGPAPSRQQHRQQQQPPTQAPQYGMQLRGGVPPSGTWGQRAAGQGAALQGQGSEWPPMSGNGPAPSQQQPYHAPHAPQYGTQPFSGAASGGTGGQHTVGQGAALQSLGPGLGPGGYGTRSRSGSGPTSVTGTAAGGNGGNWPTQRHNACGPAAAAASPLSKGLHGVGAGVGGLGRGTASQGLWGSGQQGAVGPAGGMHGCAAQPQPPRSGQGQEQVQQSVGASGRWGQQEEEPPWPGGLWGRGGAWASAGGDGAPGAGRRGGEAWDSGRGEGGGLGGGGGGGSRWGGFVEEEEGGGGAGAGWGGDEWVGGDEGLFVTCL